MTANNSPQAVPFGPPPIWADNRQALCDALPWFKAHESSLYTNNKVAKGFLINAHPAVRDIVGTEVIITSLGGGRKKDGQGNMIRVVQGARHILEACTTSMERAVPIGNKYPGWSVEVKHVFNVLDYFTITDIWSERDATSGVHIYKMRLEKTDRSTPSWWQSKGEVQHAVKPREAPQNRAQCFKCRKSSKQMFTQGWTCLNAECEDCFIFPKEIKIQELTFTSQRAAPLAWCIFCRQECKAVFSCNWTCLNKDCDKFFTFPTGVNIDRLSYSEDFLQERTSHQSPKEPLLPSLPDTNMQGFLGTEKAMREGIVCPDCHGCSRRMHWTHWAYENPKCRFSLGAKPQPFPLHKVLSEEKRENKKKSFTTKIIHENILVNAGEVNGYGIEQYLLPDPLRTDPVILGAVTVFRASGVVNSRDGAPNKMWELLQDDTVEDFGFRRNPAIHPGLPTEKLTRHFLQNWGAPYKFAVAVASKSFSEAPESIIGALKRMQWAGRVSIEMMNISLKEYAKLPDWRDLTRCNTLTEGFVDFNELLSLGYMEDDRIGYHDDGEDTLGPTVATLSLGSPALMTFKMKKSYAGRDDVVLRFPLYHGDVVVMHGPRIHQAYLHKVAPKGKRRFALTCRNIVLDTLDEVTRVDAIQKSVLPAVSALWDYPKPSDAMEGATTFHNRTKMPRNTKKRTAKRVNDEAQGISSRMKRHKAKA
ncbi:hypothetical protein EsH8_III_001176 [Colletotrichum jinshuiense]